MLHVDIIYLACRGQKYATILAHNSEADLLIGVHAVSAMFQLHSGGFSKIILILTPHVLYFFMKATICMFLYLN